MPSIKKVSEIFGLVLKVMIAVAVLALIAVGYQTCSGTPLIQRVDHMAPVVEKAPYQVYTSTHLYYAVKATQNGSRVVMNGYYAEDKSGRWIYYKGTISLTEKLNPRIVRR